MSVGIFKLVSLKEEFHERYIDSEFVDDSKNKNKT